MDTSHIATQYAPLLYIIFSDEQPISFRWSACLYVAILRGKQYNEIPSIYLEKGSIYSQASLSDSKKYCLSMIGFMLEILVYFVFINTYVRCKGSHGTSAKNF